MSVLTIAVWLCSSGNAQGAFAGDSLSVTPTAEELKAELLACGMKPPQRSGLPSIRTGRLGQRSASDAQTTLPFSPAQQEPPALTAFPQAVSCPPEFWGELLADISIVLHGLVARRCLQSRPVGWCMATALGSCSGHAKNKRLCSSRRLQKNPPDRLLWTPAGEDKPQELCAGRQAKSMEFLLDNLLDLSVAALVSPSGSLGRLAATQEDLGFTMRSPFEQLVHPGAGLQAA